MKTDQYPHIATQRDYETYKEAVAETFRLNELENLTGGAYECPQCQIPLDFTHEPWCCPECGIDYEEASKNHFSWRPCECCHRPLGGDRYPASGYSRQGVVYMFEICVDCLYYNEYGRLDDITMLDNDLV